MIGRLLTALGRMLLSLRYRVQVEGLEAVQQQGGRGILFLPNHPALIDPVILLSHLFRHFQPRTLADKDQVSVPGIRWAAERLRALPLPDPSKYGEASRAEIQKALQLCVEALKAGENLMIYPAGRLMRSRFEDLGGNGGVLNILEQVPEARVVLVRTRGLWGSHFSRASGKAPRLGQALGKSVLTLLKNALFFAPRRKVVVELVEPADLPRGKGRAALNRYLEAFYNLEAPPNTYVPKAFWEKGRVRACPEPVPGRMGGDPAVVAAATREAVLRKLRQISGIAELSETHTLARDLGLDSLSRLELQVWLEGEFAFVPPDPEALQTVGDVLLAASGSALDESAGQKHVPDLWFEHPVDLPPTIPEGRNLAEVFLAQAARDPHRAVVADATSGVKSYWDVITAILVLKPVLEKLPGPYLGIMLPATVGGSILYLAALFAGKTPVMVNWTVGARNMAHSLDLLDVRHVLTAGPLIAKLEAQGVKLEGIKERFILLDEVGKGISLFSKLWAAARSHLYWGSLRKARIPDTAVVLFTSGSENLPKAVPLSQANLLANLRDIEDSIRFTADDRFLGFLPPFHSFGLTCTVILPMVMGLRVVFHPNPTEARALARAIEGYKCSLLVGTPTFLHAIMRVASLPQLQTLRLVVTGAEKCPEPLYESISRRWPRMVILEGYGITECSPVVSVNRESDLQHCTIGRVLPSLEHAVVDIESGKRAAPGQEGMLLVRGPSVFPGYLNYDGPSPFEMWEGKDWYRTGDLVRESEGGVLTFAGRLKRFVKLGGEMVSLPAIEEALLNRFMREEDTEPVLAVEATSTDTNPDVVLFTVRDITREVANAALKDCGLSSIHNIRIVKRLEAIPLLGTGKTNYRALKETLDPPCLKA
jgi:long-chain-fatty-acid--[acyl-carrier-protein] ligase